MSTLWTPEGERPVGRPREEPRPKAAGAGEEAHTGPGPGPGPDDLDAEMAEAQRRLAQTPAAVVVANHGLGLFHLAALHLSQQPPHLEDAQLAIDAMAALVEGLSHRLGDDEDALREALSQVRLAFVQIKTTAGEGAQGS